MSVLGVVGTGAVRRWPAFRTAALVTAGLASATYGIAQLFGAWGWIAAGVSFFVIEALTDSSDDSGGDNG